MKTEEEIKDQIKLYEYYIKQWRLENETQYYHEIKLVKRLIEELEWVLEQNT